MFCSKCGNENKEDVQFCNKCGATLVSIDNFEKVNQAFYELKEQNRIELNIVRDASIIHINILKSFFLEKDTSEQNLKQNEEYYEKLNHYKEMFTAKYKTILIFDPSLNSVVEDIFSYENKNISI
jgi:hypothetical protein